MGAEVTRLQHVQVEDVEEHRRRPEGRDRRSAHPAARSRKGDGEAARPAARPRAVELVRRLDYDFAKWEGGRSLKGAMLRARMFDRYVEKLLRCSDQGGPTRRTSRPSSRHCVVEPSTLLRRRWRSTSTRTMPRFAGRHPKTFTTLLGPLTLERAYYHCDACRTGVCPRDRTLGTHATSLSPGVLRMVGRAASDFSFAAASDLLWKLAAVRAETKQVERCAEALGRAVADDERTVFEPVPSPVADDVPGVGRQRRAGARGRGRRPRWQAAGRFGQDPRGQAGHRVKGRRARPGGPARARPRVGQL